MPNIKLLKKIDDAVDYIKKQTDFTPDIGIILGTGLGALVKDIKIEKEIEYKNIPNFPVSTVESHQGKLILGILSDKKVVCMQGRFHYYEGYSMEQVTFPVRVMKFLGVKKLVVSNVCGGLNPLFNVGDLMIITDHINLMGVNPLIGINDNRLGERFADLCDTYTKELVELAEETALENKIPVNKGVYAAMTGPNLETKAEYRFLRMIGADGIGMSTVPEVIVAVQSEMKILGISVISDRCLPDALEPVCLEKIIEAANKAEPKLAKLIKKVIERL